MFSLPPPKTLPQRVDPLKHLALKVNKAYANQTHQTIAKKKLSRDTGRLSIAISPGLKTEKQAKTPISESLPESGPATYFETCCLKVQVSNFTHISGLAALLFRNQETGRHLLGHLPKPAASYQYLPERYLYTYL